MCECVEVGKDRGGRKIDYHLSPLQQASYLSPVGGFPDGGSVNCGMNVHSKVMARWHVTCRPSGGRRYRRLYYLHSTSFPRLKAISLRVSRKNDNGILAPAKNPHG